MEKKWICFCEKKHSEIKNQCPRCGAKKPLGGNGDEELQQTWRSSLDKLWEVIKNVEKRKNI